MMVDLGLGYWGSLVSGTGVGGQKHFCLRIIKKKHGRDQKEILYQYIYILMYFVIYLFLFKCNYGILYF